MNDPHLARQTTQASDSAPVAAGHVDTTTILKSGSELVPGADLSGRDFGRYKVREVLGRGGMGVVYRAFDTQLEREVALKIPRFFDCGTDFGDMVRRVYREARAVAGLHHPNICPIYDVGETGGQHYISMPLIDGQTLAKYAHANGPLNSMAVASIVSKLACALQEAHAAGIVHRDLKPANIMMDRRGEPIIMDFGLARRTDVDEARLTRTGDLVGTPLYMSPEQFEGISEMVGPASDIYSLGMLLFELVAGRPAFAGTPAKVIKDIISQPPPKLEEIRPDVDPRLAAICRRMLEKRVEDRPRSMAEVAAAIKDLLTPSRDGAVPAPTSMNTERGSRQRIPRAAWATAGVALSALVVYLGFNRTDPTVVPLESSSPANAVAGSGTATNTSTPTAAPSANKLVEIVQQALSSGGRVKVGEKGSSVTHELEGRDKPPSGQFVIIDLDLAGTDWSDSQLGPIENLTSLEWLDVRQTKVTARSIARLQALLPNCAIESDYQFLRGDFSQGIWRQAGRGEVSFVEGAAKLRTYTDSALLYAENLPEATDFEFTIRTYIVSGELELGYGPVFWLQDANNYFCFDIRMAGDFRLVQHINGEARTLIPWTASPLIRKWANQTHELAVRVEGRELTLLVNGLPLASYEADEAHTGKVGCHAAARVLSISIDQWEFASKSL